MHSPLPAALDSLADEPDLVSAIWSSFDVIESVRLNRAQRDAGRFVRAITSRRAYRDDFLFHITGLAVIGVLGGPHARAELLAVAYAGDARARPYAAQALVGNVTTEAVPALCVLLSSDDPFVRMAAQDAIVSVPPRGAAANAVTSGLVTLAVESASRAVRVAALDCMLPRSGYDPMIEAVCRIARDAAEAESVRAAAARALGRLGELSAIPLLTGMAVLHPHGEVGRAAAEALVPAGLEGHAGLLRAAWEGNPAARRVIEHRAPGASRAGLSVAQLVTHSTGGLSTLTTDLAAAFARREDVARITNITIGGEQARRDAVDGVEHVGIDGPVDWDSVLRIERSLDLAFHNALPDVLHLRFAGPVTLAAARWAARRDVPSYFTFAPDPIVPAGVAAADGRLTRETLAEWDARDRLIGRTALLHLMTRQAAGTALLPRADQAVAGLGAAVFAGPTRVIAEGIDVEAAGRVHTEHLEGVRKVLTAAYAPGHGRGLAPHRHGLPLLVSVGRLHPIKGMTGLVEAWAENPDLVRSVNLVVAGGNLDRPDPQEQAVLEEIEAVVRRYPEAAGGLLLTGNIPHARVGALLMVLSSGIDGLAARRPIYVCPSVKEEFGLAILEALVAGIPVVAPQIGGPASYLSDGTLGFLADTTDRTALASTLRRALELRESPERYQAMSDAGRRLVRDRYSVDRMADELLSLYTTDAVSLSVAS